MFQVAAFKIIRVASVLNRGVSAAGTMLMLLGNVHSNLL
jgi:hypothetical protein